MYVRALSKHSYGCYMLQLLPDGVGEKTLRLLFHWHPAHPLVKPSKGEGERERDPVIDLNFKIYPFMSLPSPATKMSKVEYEVLSAEFIHV